MMGERDPQKQLWSYQVNLDKRVRSGRTSQNIIPVLGLPSQIEGGEDPL